MSLWFSYVVHGRLQEQNDECHFNPAIKHGFKAPSTWADPSKCYFPLYNLSQGLQCTPETEKVKAAQISASRNTSHPCNANNSKRNPSFNADVAHTHCFLVFWHRN